MNERKFTYYNDLEDIVLKEYGRYVQGYVQHIAALEDRDKRNQMIQALMGYIKKINPALSIDTEEDQQKLWDHLHAISNYELDIDGKFPKPSPETKNTKPERIPYPTYKLRNKHYGKNLELLVEKATEITDPEERETAVISLGKLVKNFYNASNKDNVEDAYIVNLLEGMSKGELSIDAEKVSAGNLFEITKDPNKMGHRERQPVDRIPTEREREGKDRDRRDFKPGKRQHFKKRK